MNGKRATIILVILLIKTQGFLLGQNDSLFMGILEMEIENKFITKINNSSPPISPTKGIYIYKDGSFKQTFSDGFLEYSIYKSGTEYCYSKFRNNDTLFAERITYVRPYDRNFEIITKNNSDTILGLVCNKIILKFDNQVKTFIYNDTIKIDPHLFKSYKNENRDVFSKISESIPLIFKLETKEFVMTSRITSWRKEYISDNEFEIDDLPIKHMN
jgi:hypothetical protein